ncbi:MAG: LuxR C-terminal-related transcriptional regulator [Halopseudomonas aestusnigri]
MSVFVLGELEMIKQILLDKIKILYPNGKYFVSQGESIRLPFNQRHLPICVLYVAPTLTKNGLLKISAIKRHALTKIILITDEKTCPPHIVDGLNVDAIYSINKPIDGLVNRMSSLFSAEYLSENNDTYFREDPISQFQLTNKENQIFALLKKGMSNKEIANTARKSEGTVKVQLKSIYKKLNVHSRTEAMSL